MFLHTSQYHTILNSDTLLESTLPYFLLLTLWICQGRIYTSSDRFSTTTYISREQPKTYIYVVFYKPEQPWYFHLNNQGRIYTSSSSYLNNQERIYTSYLQCLIDFVGSAWKKSLVVQSSLQWRSSIRRIYTSLVVETKMMWLLRDQLEDVYIRPWLLRVKCLAFKGLKPEISSLVKIDSTMNYGI